MERDSSADEFLQEERTEGLRGLSVCIACGENQVAVAAEDGELLAQPKAVDVLIDALSEASALAVEHPDHIFLSVDPHGFDSGCEAMRFCAVRSGKEKDSLVFGEKAAEFH